MDLMKIGGYIASKRKSLGMTQVELARKLGMSDKSVSKWERGICLPDVSVYVQLCDILGITVNEFIAGEDLTEEKLVHQSEVNIIAVTEEENQKRKRLKYIFLGITAIYFIVICMMGMFQGIRFRDYIEPLPEYSAEMTMAKTVFEENGAYIYRYDVDSTFNSLSVNLSVYDNEKVVKQKTVTSIDLHDIRSDGMVLLFPDYEVSELKVVVTAEERKNTAGISLLPDSKTKTLLHRNCKSLEQSINVIRDDEVELVRFVYCEGDKEEENNCTYQLSAKFE